MLDDWTLDRFRNAFVGLETDDREESVQSEGVDSIITGHSEANRKEQTFDDKVASLKTSLHDEDDLESIRHPQQQEEKSDMKNILKEVLQETQQDTQDLFDRKEKNEPQPVDRQEVIEEIREEVIEEKTEEKKEEFEEDLGIIKEQDNDTEIQDKDMSIEQFDQFNKDTPWLLKSPSNHFDIFYAQKEKTINRILVGGILPFDEWNDELRKAHVDVTATDLYALDFIQRKMQQVQKWRDRIQEILLRTNAQYFLWKRAYDLLPGYLARTHYEKPAEKQKGVVFRHLGDMGMYFAELEALKENVHSVMKNLEGAFECLSRQLTVAQDKNRVPAKYHNDNPVSSETHFNKEMVEQFDSLDEPSSGDKEEQQRPSGVRKLSLGDIRDKR